MLHVRQGEVCQLSESASVRPKGQVRDSPSARNDPIPSVRALVGCSDPDSGCSSTDFGEHAGDVAVGLAAAVAVVCVVELRDRVEVGDLAASAHSGELGVPPEYGVGAGSHGCVWACGCLLRGEAGSELVIAGVSTSSIALSPVLQFVFVVALGFEFFLLVDVPCRRGVVRCCV